MLARTTGKLLTGPLAFLLAGVVDVLAYNAEALFRLTRRRLGPSTMPRR